MTVTVKIKKGPCGRCGAVVLRDEMHSMNIKFFAPDDSERKVRVRLCSACRDALLEEMRRMEWNNADMQEEEVPLLS